MNIIFVYGTLKKGFHNNHLLESSEFIGDGITIDKYAMFPSICGAFPFVVESYKNTQITGELYKVNKKVARKLDILEGFPDLYIKKKIGVLCVKSGEIFEATMYIKNEKTNKNYIQWNKEITEW